jgi:hypothetical protein
MYSMYRIFEKFERKYLEISLKYIDFDPKKPFITLHLYIIQYYFNISGLEMISLGIAG